MNEPRSPEQLLRITDVQARTGLSRARYGALCGMQLFRLRFPSAEGLSPG